MKLYLVVGIGACVLVVGVGSCLSEGQYYIQWFVWGVCKQGMALGHTSATGQCYVHVLLMVWHQTSGIGAFWPFVLHGLSVEMAACGRALAV